MSERKRVQKSSIRPSNRREFVRVFLFLLTLSWYLPIFVWRNFLRNWMIYDNNNKIKRENKNNRLWQNMNWKFATVSRPMPAKKKTRKWWNCEASDLFSWSNWRLWMCVSVMGDDMMDPYLLYDDGETALSGGCLFTFGLTLLTCLMEFACMLTDCWCCSCCCCCWFCCCCCCCCCGPINCGCCCALSCCEDPVMPPFERRLRFITTKNQI